jgi:cephalosporin hydroxylase
MNFEQEYINSCRKITDIHEHLPTLSNLVTEYQCKHVTELGVGPAQSTRAFLRHDVELHSYEIRPWPDVITFFNAAAAAGRRATLHINDTRTIEIQPTDLMLVDSWHTYEQVKIELKLHANKVSKFIVFHDTTSFEWKGEDGGVGIWPAIQEFLDSNAQWQIHQRYYNNNGLTVLRRV